MGKSIDTFASKFADIYKFKEVTGIAILIKISAEYCYD